MDGLGYTGFDITTNYIPLLLISILCALVELVPIGENTRKSISMLLYFIIYIFLKILVDDNVSVPISAAIFSMFLFGSNGMKDIF